MKRRLFLLLPDVEHAEQLGKDLETAAIDKQDIHAMVPDGVQLQNVDDVPLMANRDKDYAIEWWVWRSNLGLFFIASSVFIVMLFSTPSYWLLLPALAMMVTFSIGLAAVLRLPNVHIDEFRTAVRHGEILMMVDASPARLLDISQYIHRRHPEAYLGGVGWHMG